MDLISPLGHGGQIREETDERQPVRDVWGFQTTGRFMSALVIINITSFLRVSLMMMTT